MTSAADPLPRSGGPTALLTLIGALLALAGVGLLRRNSISTH